MDEYIRAPFQVLFGRCVLKRRYVLEIADPLWKKINEHPDFIEYYYSLDKLWHHYRLTISVFDVQDLVSLGYFNILYKWFKMPLPQHLHETMVPEKITIIDTFSGRRSVILHNKKGQQIYRFECSTLVAIPFEKTEWGYWEIETNMRHPGVFPN